MPHPIEIEALPTAKRRVGASLGVGGAWALHIWIKDLTEKKKNKEKSFSHQIVNQTESKAVFGSII